MCLHILVKIFCGIFCRRESHLVNIFDRNTLNAGETVNARFQLDKSFVDCRILHPEASANKHYHHRQKRWPDRWNKIKESMRSWGVYGFHFFSSTISFFVHSHTKTNVSCGKVASKNIPLPENLA